ncbi:MAG: hypothetical protein EBR52_08730 [Microbacteriaceae bacterium]|jgi:hypothetical protein|nr:hypothetical protein [Microbacteriaceae bacterium]
MEDHKFTINDQKWLWRYSSLKGSAEGWTEFATRKVLIHEKLKGRARLECEIHEGLHASLGPAISESAITSAAADIARILHSLGYRRLPPESLSG